MKAEREKIHAKVKADTVRLNGSKLELTADEEMGTFLLVSEGSCILQMGENSLLVNPGSALLLGAQEAEAGAEEAQAGAEGSAAQAQAAHTQTVLKSSTLPSNTVMRKPLMYQYRGLKPMKRRSISPAVPSICMGS